jgi:hypothetical protein
MRCSTKPRNEVKPSKIRDVNFILRCASNSSIPSRDCPTSGTNSGGGSWPTIVRKLLFLLREFAHHASRNEPIQCIKGPLAGRNADPINPRADYGRQ